MTDSEEVPDTASDDSIPCGQTRFRSTQEMQSLEARHQGLPTCTPVPVRQAWPTQKRGPDDTDKDSGLKRKCVDEAEDGLAVTGNRLDFEPEGGQVFHPR